MLTFIVRRLWQAAPRRVASGLLLSGLLSACSSPKGVEQGSAAPAEAAAQRPTLPAAPGAEAAAAPAPAAAPEVITTRIGEWQTQLKEMSYDVKPERLLQQFIREFNDGTVVDRVMVAPAQDGPRTKPTFYLVGMGQLNGKFRAMALPLDQNADNGGLYLPATAPRYIAEGTNCVMCYFRFTRGKVTGVDCSEASTGTVERQCEYRTEKGNGFFAKR